MEQWLIWEDESRTKILDYDVTDIWSGESSYSIGDKVEEEFTFSKQGHRGKYINVRHGVFTSISERAEFPALAET